MRALPLRDVDAVRLVDADAPGTYEVGGDTGGFYRYPVEADPADPPPNATAYDLANLPQGVRGPVRRIIDSGARLEPQSRAYQFLRIHERDADGCYFVLFVIRVGETYRLFAPIQTITPPCGYYVVLELQVVDGAPEATLSLAAPGTVRRAPGWSASLPRGRSVRPLGEYPDETRWVLGRFEYVLTHAGFYRVDLEQ